VSSTSSSHPSAGGDRKKGRAGAINSTSSAPLSEILWARLLDPDIFPTFYLQVKPITAKISLCLAGIGAPAFIQSVGGIGPVVLSVNSELGWKNGFSHPTTYIRWTGHSYYIF
jgi:hypothetical protein